MTTREELLIKILTLKRKDFEQLDEENSIDANRWKILGWVSPSWILLEEMNSGRLVKGRILDWAESTLDSLSPDRFNTEKHREALELLKDAHPQLFLR